ncbi:hypothetical protein [Pseudofrankia sp. DC12]|uniref:DAPG hydrolase family protein n=1 Tax=Pseudofrankia sp. DC12 TaxID=683315 RepID=UPI0018DD3E0F|nr:hypothetical protein [Pseudofrankia sp. DC12]
MTSLPDDVGAALGLGPQASPLCLSLDNVGTLSDAGYQELENGYSLADDGSMHIATLTRMPGATPAMLDWWFWWHSNETQRYKLWHPRAHLYAESTGGGADEEESYRARYVGSTSFVDEYVGSTLGELAIHFAEPAAFGFSHDRLDPDEATAVCARVGFSRLPLDWGYFVHHVRLVNGGAEMRSRFWMGGQNVAARGQAPPSGEFRTAAAGVTRLGDVQARAMAVHCSQEMSHLATFLPDIFDEFGRRRQVSQPDRACLPTRGRPRGPGPR